ncbi:Arc family DNA-binding protein [Xenorhabdus bovienii]|uniref:Arc family DNA-binding protein n=1 Tax=Xenorhabdus bovienii TaxID=40576 RepID=UPI0023B351D3|nr:Arc family DNA-binding protein [Xenorhabdus bovienii]MDE9447547.1 Arc family DNA-binding protein [Xenorhabdus bovienii]
MSRIAPYPLRMPPELREALEKKAENSHRSLQQEIQLRLEESLEIEPLVSSLKTKGDLYTQIATLMRDAQQVEGLKKDIETLTIRLTALAESTKGSDNDRFIKIENQAKVAQEALEKIIKNIPLRYEELDEKPTLARSIFLNKKAP